MRIGVFFPDVKPEEGGASTLLAAVREEIVKSLNKDEYFILYKAKGRRPYKTVRDNLIYCNINRIYFFNGGFLTKAGEFFRRRLKSFFQNHYIRALDSVYDKIVRKEKLDLLWFPTPVYADVSYPFIFTDWDLGHRVLPSFPEVAFFRGQWNGREFMYQNMLARASYILTGNETGKKEILENYSVPAERIRIAPFPVASFCYGSEKKPAFEIPEKYFFYPAQFWPHKNHIRILKALKTLKEQGFEISVIFTGSDKGNKGYIQEKAEEMELEACVIFAGFVSDEEMKWLYTHAVAMVFASLMGPNNMPPIEAAYLGCPVIITDIPGHIEQMGESALYFNGYNADELALQMRKILTDESVRQGLMSKEKELAEAFSEINYFSTVKNIVNEYRLRRECWGRYYYT